MAAGWFQECCQNAPEDPRWAPDGLKMAPRWPQDGSKIAPRWPQHGPEMTPIQPQDGPRWPKMAQTSQDCPRLPHIWPKLFFKWLYNCAMRPQETPETVQNRLHDCPGGPKGPFWTSGKLFCNFLKMSQQHVSIFFITFFPN